MEENPPWKICGKSSHRLLQGHRDPDFPDGGAGIEGRISTVGFLIKKLGLYCTGDVSGTGTWIGDFPVAVLLYLVDTLQVVRNKQLSIIMFKLIQIS
jgi:hypothetical protein